MAQRPSFSLSHQLSLLLSDNVDFSALEADRSGCGCEKGVVLAHADIGAREELCPALSHDDRACLYHLTAEQLYASVLRIAVSAVPRRALSFFMCHNQLPLLLGGRPHY